MYEDELARVGEKIRQLYTGNILSGRPIIMFGVSENTRQMIQMVRELNYSVSYVIDNDETRTGSYFARVPVIRVSDIEAYEIEEGIYFIYSYFWREMFSQLVGMGVNENRIFSFFLPNRTLDEQFNMVRNGKEICDRFLNKYGDYSIFLCPYTGTGDIYLIGTFWQEYLKNKNITGYIFVVVSRACEKVTRIFDIKNVEIISQIESSYMVEYYKLCGDSSGIKILNDSWWELRANPLQRFRGFKGLYFTEIFRKFVFDLPETAKPVQPVLGDVKEELDDIFERYGLIEGKTVVLSPFSNTLADLPEEFWRRLVQDLKKKDYVICTNCGNDKEQEIDGTNGVFVPLDIMPQFIEMAGGFIGVRSGLCDCISAAKAKKIILYDKRNRFFNSSAFEYFSLNAMGLCEDAIELMYDENADDIISEIVSYL